MALLNRKQIEDIILRPTKIILTPGSKWQKTSDGFYWGYAKEKNDTIYGVYIYWYGECNEKNKLIVNEPDLVFQGRFNNLYGTSEDTVGVELPSGDIFHFA